MTANQAFHESKYRCECKTGRKPTRAFVSEGFKAEILLQWTEMVGSVVDDNDLPYTEAADFFYYGIACFINPRLPGISVAACA